MTAYLIAAVVLAVAGLGPCAWVCFRGRPEDQMIALGLTGTVQSLILLLLAAGYGEAALGVGRGGVGGHVHRRHAALCPIPRTVGLIAVALARRAEGR